MGGLELIINQTFKNNDYFFIERNYVSKKVKYGWGGMSNEEGYNNLDLQKIFLKMNEMGENQIKIFDYDNDNLPERNFDVIISLLSLDYHYDFNIYVEYLKKVSHINLTKTGVEIIGKSATYLSNYERMFAHSESIKSRMRRK